MSAYFVLVILCLQGLMLTRCGKDETANSGAPDEVKEPRWTGPRLKKIGENTSGLDFQNTLTETEALNYFVHSGFYNGAGVAVGDVNNDGLVDLYFAGNQVQNELYLNKGELRFEKITESAGVAAAGKWCGGVTMVDLNSDGFLDIYVSVYFDPDKKTAPRNFLFLNNGDLTFTEKATDFGLDDPGNSVQTTFFDYDLDGDLDAYVLNQPTNWRAEKPKITPPNGWKDTDRLYQNQGDGTFKDVTAEAGIENYGYGLSVV
ncbi:MAG: VCBS repeat-containing protein, partial [Bacteroidota bacterium]